MAIQASTQWRIRADGAESNGGGYDPSISGAGTDYTDQAAAQLTLTDLACAAASPTTLTSATGGFTAAMIGNCVRIDASESGTNFIDGYFFITGHTNTNTVTIDRTCNNGSDASSGTGRLGGAFALLTSLMTNGEGGLGTPLVATPLAAGHTVYIRGAGTNDPSVVDYDYKGTTTSGYYTCPTGNTTSGRIRFVGYNGRPLLQTSGLLLIGGNYLVADNLSIKKVTSCTWVTYGFFDDAQFNNSMINCIVDMNGNDATGVTASNVIGNEFRNPAGGSAGSRPAVNPLNYGYVANNYIHDVRGVGVNDSVTGLLVIENNIVESCGAQGIALSNSSFGSRVLGNMIHACGSDGVRVSHAVSVANSVIRYNVLTKNGGYGINCSVGSTALNDRLIRGRFDYNAFGSGTEANTSGSRNNYTAGANDVQLTDDVSPYENVAAGDFNLNNTTGGGALLRAVEITLP